MRAFSFLLFPLCFAGVTQPGPALISAAGALLGALLPPSPAPLALQRLSYLSDTFGPRPSGSPALDAALSWVASSAAVDGLLVRQLALQGLPQWSRGAESATLILPRPKRLSFASLVYSSSSSSAQSNTTSITAPVSVLSARTPAAALAALQGSNSSACRGAQGAILLFNTPLTSPALQLDAAAWAAACGAVAALLRSTTGLYALKPALSPAPTSLAAPVPVGVISTEDALLLQRASARGQATLLTLSLQAQRLSASGGAGRLLLLELPGATLPQQVVLLGGALDTLDAAEGAQDSGGAAVVCWEALRVIAALSSTGAIPAPARTLRAALWVSAGGAALSAASTAAYLASLPPLGAPGSLGNHSAHLHVRALGAGAPWGVQHACAPDADCSAAGAQLSALGAALLGSAGWGAVSALELANASAAGEGVPAAPPPLPLDTGLPCLSLGVSPLPFAAQQVECALGGGCACFPGFFCPPPFFFHPCACASRGSAFPLTRPPSFPPPKPSTPAPRLLQGTPCK